MFCDVTAQVMAKEAQAAAGSEAPGHPSMRLVGWRTRLGSSMTGNLRKRIQLLIVGPCYGGFFVARCGSFPRTNRHYCPKQLQKIVAVRES